VALGVTGRGLGPGDRVRHVETRPGLYRDSVRLMEISTALSGLPEVDMALVAMATGLNLELLSTMGFTAPPGIGPNDLVVAVSVESTVDNAMTGVLERLEIELASSGAAPGGWSLSTSDGTGDLVHPRTTGSLVEALGAGLVLVSTPGRHAFVEAMDALDAGASVMVFSDNVPVEQELRLKRTATERGLLVMGPDCGTAVVGGVGLGFANVVRPGPVGLVAASGTGAQQVMSLLALVPGAGISHCLGVGGRDLSAAIGGLSTHAALDALDADPATELIVLIGKPPAPAVAEAVREHAARLATPVHLATLGEGQPDLTAATEAVLGRLGLETPQWTQWPAVPGNPGGGAIRGLFSGGTLCVEAQVIAAGTLGPIGSNVPLRPEWTFSTGHHMIDLGADEYTVGRPHPMIDYGPRLALLAAAAADPGCRVILLDVVLGHGAHPDPAAELGPAIRSALTRPEPLDVVVSLIGTPDDPQGLAGQGATLAGAGANAFLSNAGATRSAVSRVESR
jgi:FdrA protein